MREIQSGKSWAEAQVGGLPPRWQRRLLTAWSEKAKPRWASFTHAGVRKWFQTANSGAWDKELRDVVRKLESVRLPLSAADSDVTTRADELAVQCMDVGRMQDVEKVRAAMEAFCWGVGVVPPGIAREVVQSGGRVRFVVRRGKMADRPAIARMTCANWWRRALRKLHAKAVEGAAIQLGYVNKAADLYVSNESLERRRQQIRRNAATLESTLMRNEKGQEYTLAELAALGVANKAIRRGELMTRIAGFEVIARECEHAGLFITMTCPSRMHKWNRGRHGKVYRNDKYDGTTPREAQRHLCKVWARIRAALARVDVGLYGFRIAEPHHDGCPHWHLLVFHEKGQGDAVEAVFRRYALADSPDEAGAGEHRVAFLSIDWDKGSAAGYIAKYVAKNIDGLHVGDDLFGNPAIETSQRVEAWASTWGIRQFQQIGGAPVGVWRELRRVKELPETAEECAEHLARAHEAVNRIEGDGGEVKAASWAEYCKAQGGVFVGRDARIKLAMEQTGEIGRYGEVKAARPVGVETVFKVAFGIAYKWLSQVVESVRHVWEVVRGARSAPPRTRVNNCTPPGSEVFEAVGCFST